MIRWISSVLLGVYIVGVAGNYLVPGTWPFLVSFGMGLVLFLIAFGIERTSAAELGTLMGLGSIVMGGLLLHSLIHGELPEKVLFVPGNLAIAALLLRGAIQPRITAACVYFLAILFGGLFLPAAGTDVRRLVLFGGSQNVVSELVIFATVLHYTALRQAGARKLPISPAIACFAVCVVAMGRSGMIASALLVVGVFLLRHAQPLRPSTLIASAVALALFSTLVYTLMTRTEFGAMLQRFAEFGFDSPERRSVYSSYVAALRHKSGWLVGFPMDTKFAGWVNLHNSYLLWHRWLGILALPLLMLTLATIVTYIVKDWVYALLFGVILLRAFFDENLLPFWMFDFLFYFFVAHAAIGSLTGHRRTRRLGLGRARGLAPTC